MVEKQGVWWIAATRHPVGWSRFGCEMGAKLGPAPPSRRTTEWEAKQRERMRLAWWGETSGNLWELVIYPFKPIKCFICKINTINTHTEHISRPRIFAKKFLVIQCAG